MEEDPEYSKPDESVPGMLRPGKLFIEKIKLPGIAIGSPEEIVFTQKGLLAGRVLVEIEEEHYGEWKYRTVICIVWFSLIVLFITAIVIPFSKMVWGTLGFLNPL